MKTQFIYQLCFYFCIAFLASCNSEDDDNSNDSSNNVITINIDEYPSAGDFIADINSSLEGNLAYVITFESVPDALIVNGNELRVGDWLAFDFETNENIFITIEVSNGEDTEVLEYKIAIQDVDDIWAFLNGSSRTAYENASDGDWIWITESEYNDLANYLSNATKSGASDDQIYNNTSVESSSGNRTIANNNDFNIPSNSYLFAFKYYSWVNNVSTSRIKLSQDDAGGSYQDVGNVLPEHNDEYNHFVLKGSNSATTSEGFIGMYAGGTVGVKDDNNSSYKWRNGNVNNLDNTANGIVYLHQGLSTTLKQWD
ncbi:hypothetical protein [uncultured Psychroserpens sp.]|uniref:hypothetical protein n=1 Tax=uncultured Psychroserpens sp. TaxID=255436 RepID=UPI0026072846|nr:hypothetical protein [uncultured Psychroserpens sp.]